MKENVKTRVDKTFEIISKLRQDHIEQVGSELKKCLKQFFCDQKIIKSVLWAQYTPNFPTYSKQGFFIEDREYSQYHDCSGYNQGEGYKLKQITENRERWVRNVKQDKLDEFLAASNELEKIFVPAHTIFLDLFGDHAQVIVSMKKIQVISFNHK